MADDIDSREPPVPGWLRVAFVVVALAFLLQMPTPLRLMKDSVEYLGVADSVASGTGFLLEGAKSRFPPGYPALLASFISLGLEISPAVVLWNTLLLFLGVWAVQLACRRVYGLTRTQGLVLALVTIVSFHFVKHATVPMSDPTFFGVSSTALLCLVIAEQRTGAGRWRWFAAALPLVACGLLLRSVGMALLAAALWIVVRSPFFWKRLAPSGRISRRAWIGLCTGVVVALVAGLLIVRQTLYWDVVVERYQLSGGLLGGLQLLAKMRLVEIGVVTTNFPRPPMVLPLMVRRAWVLGQMLLAIPAIALILRGLWARRDRPSVLEAYTVAYLGILWVMPFSCERHTMQVVPLLFMFGWIALREILSPATVARFVRAYVVWLLVTGAGWLAMSTWITYSGEDFPNRYQQNVATYRVIYGLDPDEGQANPSMIRLLRKYDPRFADGD